VTGKVDISLEMGPTGDLWVTWWTVESYGGRNVEQTPESQERFENARTLPLGLCSVRTKLDFRTRKPPAEPS
jgi:hypothetical protein